MFSCDNIVDIAVKCAAAVVQQDSRAVRTLKRNAKSSALSTYYHLAVVTMVVKVYISGMSGNKEVHFWAELILRSVSKGVAGVYGAALK